jgi:hypothetical protein
MLAEQEVAILSNIQRINVLKAQAKEEMDTFRDV